MSEPTGAATTVALAATATAATAPVLGIDPAIVIGAFTGAGVFIVSDQSSGVIKRLLLFIISVACGCLSAGFVAALVELIFPVEVPHTVGAIIASSVSVRILQQLIQIVESPHSLGEIIRGRKP